MMGRSGIPFHTPPPPPPQTKNNQTTKQQLHTILFPMGPETTSFRGQTNHYVMGICAQFIPIKEQVISEHLLNHQSWHVHHVVHFRNDALVGVEVDKLLMVFGNLVL